MEDNDPSLSVTALTVVLGLIFGLYFWVRAVFVDLPLYVHRALVEVPAMSEHAANALSMLW